MAMIQSTVQEQQTGRSSIAISPSENHRIVNPPTAHSDLEAFKTYLITHRQVSPRVAKYYVYIIGKFLRWVHPETVSVSRAMQYYRYLQDQGYANSTVANNVFALNHYYQFLGKTIRLQPPKRHQRQPDYLTVEEAQSLLKVIPNLRDRAIVMTLLYTGTRVNELCNLNLSDLHLERNEIVIRNTKTYQDRKVIISTKYVEALREYLDSEVSKGEAVFTSRNGKRISRSRVYAMVRMYGKLAGIQKRISPHVLRHTLATNMIAKGASVVEVKDQLGHRSIESTMRYVHLQIDHRKKLYEEHCPCF
jgi:integrase/recombinase XerD